MIGEQAFQAQYQQDLRPGASTYLKLEDLTLVEELPPLEKFTRRTQSWDTAAKDKPSSEFSVGLTFGWHDLEERWYLFDICRERPGYGSPGPVPAPSASWSAIIASCSTGTGPNRQASSFSQSSDRCEAPLRQGLPSLHPFGGWCGIGTTPNRRACGRSGRSPV